MLAAQHLRVLQKRMGSDVRVELLSSLVKRTRDETAALREEMADPEGNVDVVVGTHALLADKVEWGRLGLLIVDEEQRFGVKQKERIKQKATEVDVLSLSATPIPRTLYMCLSGIRNMSVLATPPEGRLSVQTTLMERDDARMELAIRAELERGGQVFYVVPRIEMIADEVPRNSAAQFGAIRRNSAPLSETPAPSSALCRWRCSSSCCPTARSRTPTAGCAIWRSGWCRSRWARST